MKEVSRKEVCLFMVSPPLLAEDAPLNYRKCSISCSLGTLAFLVAFEAMTEKKTQGKGEQVEEAHLHILRRHFRSFFLSLFAPFIFKMCPWGSQKGTPKERERGESFSQQLFTHVHKYANVCWGEDIWTLANFYFLPAHNKWEKWMGQLKTTHDIGDTRVLINSRS